MYNDYTQLIILSYALLLQYCAYSVVTSFQLTSHCLLHQMPKMGMYCISLGSIYNDFDVADRNLLLSYVKNILP